ncbi:MAG: PadR family transcriptional regulator [Candidatus Diapherotrites archaeon]|nr:PadR family transcriptional regulator [Candidatus Diapherotrites archaeon]
MGKETESCCDMRGMLSFLILFLISKKARNGQDIADELEKRKGARPSPGTVYPALKSLKEAGWIKEKKHGKSVLYHLSPEGKRILKVAKERFCQAFMDIF